MGMRKRICKLLEGDESKSMKIKHMRKLLSQKKPSLSKVELKQKIKEAIVELTEKGKIIQSGKIISLLKKTVAPTTGEKRKLEEATEPESKKQKVEEATEEIEESKSTPQTTEQDWLELNPNGITRLFVGNLSFTVTEKTLKDHLVNCTHVLFLKDKETKAFYGSGFVEMKTAEDAARVSKLNGKRFLGRGLKISFAPPRPGQTWPPENKYAVRPYPGNGCRKLFIANIAFEAEDEDFTKLFAECGEIAEMRWLTDRDTGEFKGCGFVEFATIDGCQKAAEFSGEEVKGRKIRIDWAEQ